MGWNFRKSITILPGVRLNFGKRGLNSASFGPRGLKINTGKKGTFLGASIPGTGIYFRERISERPSVDQQRNGNGSPVNMLAVFIILFLGGSLLGMLVYLALPLFQNPEPIPIPAKKAEIVAPRARENDTVDYSRVVTEAKTVLSRKRPLTELELNKVAMLLASLPHFAPEYAASRVLMSDVDRRRMKLALRRISTPAPSEPSALSDDDHYSPSYESGPVTVRGYYRSDGTYVRPHSRSAPRRR